ncbi:hypothetical protein [Staphylococcus sp. GDY8P79P]|uniref:hypothetical protein n=1 Tax=Staphylococcus sp. GDY8P79P TaxID=2804427 RepID=UPI00195137AC|nr:hypothetical protein [Staphylococcus sp. GDY8P79P]
MNELQLSDDLPIIESELKAFKEMNGYSIYEIGRRLKHVKENDLVHGQWTEWLEKVDVHPREAQRFIKIVSDPQLKTTTWSHLGSRALYEITGVPVEEREKKHMTEKGEEKSVDEMTIKEIQDLKQQLKQRDEEKSHLESQLEQAQRSESIARKQLEDEQDKEPEVVEREIVKEVIPEEVQKQLEQFKQKFERESNNANELRDELQRYRDSFSDPNQAYEEKELTRLERESSINAHKISISIQNFIKENSVETYRLDTVIKANPKSKERLEENVALLKEFTSNLEAMLNGRIIVN